MLAGTIMTPSRCDFYYLLLILQKKVMERVLIGILGSSGQISDLVCDEVPLVKVLKLKTFRV
jgi:hypothetical protein